MRLCSWLFKDYFPKHPTCSDWLASSRYVMAKIRHWSPNEVSSTSVTSKKTIQLTTVYSVTIKGSDYWAWRLIYFFNSVSNTKTKPQNISTCWLYLIRAKFACCLLRDSQIHECHKTVYSSTNEPWLSPQLIQILWVEEKTHLQKNVCHNLK